ncbi:hypothetical protein BV898_03716 [Hypsibius exemplaris]|uniref:Uncharacterized protein n=1 Tax=Hypsibius exemplaris TaxID=2072580 RepID=A0A1W0X4F2_HYPEX|nr:hypothetical protein BV898_03716 [Hypsibius exemplaris]
MVPPPCGPGSAGPLDANPFSMISSKSRGGRMGFILLSHGEKKELYGHRKPIWILSAWEMVLGMLMLLFSNKELIPNQLAALWLLGCVIVTLLSSATEIQTILSIPAYFHSPNKRPIPSTIYAFLLYSVLLAVGAALSTAAAIHGAYYEEKPANPNSFPSDLSVMVWMRCVIAVIQTVLVVIIVPLVLYCLHDEYGHLLHPSAGVQAYLQHERTVSQTPLPVEQPTLPLHGTATQPPRHARRPVVVSRERLPGVPEDEELLPPTRPPPAYYSTEPSRPGSPPPAFSSGRSTRQNSMQSLWSLPPEYSVSCNSTVPEPV